MRLQLLRAALHLHRLIAARLGLGQAHGLVKQREAVRLVNRLGGAGLIVKDDKRLALGLEVLLGDNVDDLAKLGEDGAQRARQGLNLDPFFEILDVYPAEIANSRLAWGFNFT